MARTVLSSTTTRVPGVRAARPGARRLAGRRRGGGRALRRRGRRSAGARAGVLGRRPARRERLRGRGADAARHGRPRRSSSSRPTTPRDFASSPAAATRSASAQGGALGRGAGCASGATLTPPLASGAARSAMTETHTPHTDLAQGLLVDPRLRSVLHAALDCVIAMDAAARVVEWNAAAERTFGYGARGRDRARDGRADRAADAARRAPRRARAATCDRRRPRMLDRRMRDPRPMRRDGTSSRSS